MDNIIVAVIMIALVVIPSELCNCKGSAGGEKREHALVRTLWMALRPGGIDKCICM